LKRKVFDALCAMCNTYENNELKYADSAPLLNFYCMYMSP
jgi:hypothetical protein